MLAAHALTTSARQLLAAALLSVALPSMTARAQCPPGQVLGHTQINSTEGGITGTPGSEFGRSLASLGDINADGTCDLAVGAFGASRVWLLELASDGSVLAESFIDDDDGPWVHDEWFGYAVTSLGDLDGNGHVDLAVGAIKDRDAAVTAAENELGAVWVLLLDTDGSLSSSVQITEDRGGFTGNLEDGDWFGKSLAALGDVDGDGITDLAVGGSRSTTGPYGASLDDGAVWILFLNADGTVKAHQKITGSMGGFGGALAPWSGFGSAVAARGDVDGNGVPDLAVGARFDDDGGFLRGAVWLLDLAADGSVIAERKISATSGGFTGPLHDVDHFGLSLATIGDLDGDGLQDLAVGAPLCNDGGSGLTGDLQYGSLWTLLMNADDTVASALKISALSGGFTGTLENKDYFGMSVAALGDLDGDGHPELAVGAHNGGDDDRGSVWILTLAGPTWFDLDGATTGTSGQPELITTGTLEAGSPVTVDLLDGPPNELALLWLSAESTPVDVFGGTVYAIPNLVELLVATDGSGHVGLTGAWPAGAVPCTDVWFQFLCQDPSVVFGITLSNSMRGTTP